VYVCVCRIYPEIPYVTVRCKQEAQNLQQLSINKLKIVIPQDLLLRCFDRQSDSQIKVLHLASLLLFSPTGLPHI